jgi:hypothetical protein
MPIDYSKGKIYKLTTIHNPDLIYYGSTVNSLYKRKGQHKCSFLQTTYNKCLSYKLFELGVDDVEITLVESVNCNNKEELHKRERFYIENNNCINKCIPTRTYTEYREQNKDIIKLKKKKYYEENKDKVKEYKEENKDKIEKYQKIYRKKYYEENTDMFIERQKKYAEENKDKIREYKKKYAELNKDKIREYNKQYYILKKKIIE